MKDIEGSPLATGSSDPGRTSPASDRPTAPPSRHKLVNVEAGRGIAALLVVLYHVDRYYFTTPKYWTDPAWDGLFKFGHAGVQFFFVLSGYIMMTVHRRDIGKPAKVGPFLLKRFHRIYPFFWVVMAVTMALYLKFPETGRPEYRDPSVILQSFLLVGADPFHAPVFVSWTLWHEMLFYAVFAVVIAAPRFGLALFGAWVVACLWQPFFLPHPPWPIYLTSFMNCLFGMGIAAAAALDRWRIPAARLLVAMGALTYLGTGLANDASSAIPVALSDALYGLGSALMLLGAVEAERCGKLRAPRWLVALGAASFSIYLTHMLTLPLIGKVATRLGLTHTVPAWAAFPGMAIAAALAGLVVHYLFEKRIVAFSRSAAEAVAQVFGGRQAAIAVKKESIPSED